MTESIIAGGLLVTMICGWYVGKCLKSIGEIVEYKLNHDTNSANTKVS